MFAIGDVEAVAVEVGEHPLVGIEAVTVGEFHAVVKEAELRTEGSGATHRGIGVQPEIVVFADPGNFADGINCVGRSRTHCRANEARKQACLFVGLDLTG